MGQSFYTVILLENLWCTWYPRVFTMRNPLALERLENPGPIGTVAGNLPP